MNIKNLFWKCIAEKYIPQDSPIKELNDIYFEYIDTLCYKFADYRKKVDFNDQRFFEDPDDCYDGLHLTSEILLKFFDGVIMEGKDTYDDFVQDIFDGDIVYYTERDVSCGNSSCLYLIYHNESSWAGLVDNYYNELFFGTDRLNRIYNITCEPF